MNDTPKKKEVWGFWETIGFTLLTGFTILIAQTFGLIIYLVFLKLSDPLLNVRHAAETLMDNGLFLSVAALIDFPISVGLTVFFCKLRKGITVRDYLSLRWVKTGTMLICIGIALLTGVLTDGLSFLLGKPIVPPFMTSVYKTAGSLPLLWIAICVLAPISEEIFFRGFFYKGLSRSRLGTTGTIIFTSLCWALFHAQYDAYGMASIFVGGLVLGTARAKTHSVVPCILMHVSTNILATIETVVTIHN